MKINQLFKATFMAVFIAVICLTSLVSCSSDANITEDNQETQLILKSTEPVSDFKFTTEMISVEGGCFKYRVSLFWTVRNLNGTTTDVLMNDVIMQSGAGCDYEGEVTNEYTGPYKNEWIISDKRYNDAIPIREFWDSHPEEYIEYTLVRDKVIGS